MERIIDAHVHIMTKERIAGLMRWIRRAFPDHPVDPQVGEEGIQDDLRRNAIQFFFNFVYPLKVEETDFLNDFNAELGRRMPQAAPFGSLHIETEDKHRVTERCIEGLNLVGMKFHPFAQRFDPTDERMFAVYEVLEEYGRPVVLHTGFEEFYRMKMPPEDIEQILRRFPRLVLVLAHCLFPHFKEVRALMGEYEGVWLDATNCFGAIKYLDLVGMNTAAPDGTGYAELLGGLVVDFADRTIFGTDHPVGMGGLDEIYHDFRSFGLPAEVERAILWENPMAFIERFSPALFVRWCALMEDTGERGR
jgi:predicted TIM-barrel fold metal-dependent hydrolase